MANARIALADGETAYELAEPAPSAVSEERPVVVLVHGLASPAFVWDDVVPSLVAAGHTALRYDLYGRGSSARPDVRYSLELHVRQLDQLVDAVLGARTVTLVAYSWGAGLASVWAARRGARVRRVVLVAPGGLEVGLAQRLVALPAFGELATRLAGRRALRADLERAFVQPVLHSAFIARVLAQLDEPGFARAYLSCLRHVASDLGAYYADLAAHDLPVDVLWGTRDRKVPFALATRLSALVPAARLHALEGAGHAAPVEHAALFAETLLRVLATPPR